MAACVGPAGDGISWPIRGGRTQVVASQIRRCRHLWGLEWNRPQSGKGPSVRWFGFGSGTGWFCLPMTWRSSSCVRSVVARPKSAESTRQSKVPTSKRPNSRHLTLRRPAISFPDGCSETQPASACAAEPDRSDHSGGFRSGPGLTSSCRSSWRCGSILFACSSRTMSAWAKPLRVRSSRENSSIAGMRADSACCVRRTSAISGGAS